MKAMIRDKEGTPPKQQILTLGRWMLMDDRTLSDYNIQNDNTIIMHIRSRGGDIGSTFDNFFNNLHDADDRQH